MAGLDDEIAKAWQALLEKQAKKLGAFKAAHNGVQVSQSAGPMDGPWPLLGSQAGNLVNDSSEAPPTPALGVMTQQQIDALQKNFARFVSENLANLGSKP